MSNHRRPAGEQPGFDYPPREPRRHRYLDEDEPVEYESGPERADFPDRAEAAELGYHRTGYTDSALDDRVYGHHQPGPDYLARQDAAHSEPAHHEPVHRYREDPLDEPAHEHTYDRSAYDEAAYDQAAYDQAAYDERAYDEHEVHETEYDGLPVDDHVSVEGRHDAPYNRADAAFDEAETQVIAAIPVERPAPPSRVHERREQKSRGRARRGKILGALAAAVVLVVLAGMVFVGGTLFFGGPDAPADYPGPGGPEVVVQVHAGDTAEEIATTLAERDVVASGSAFFNAAVQNTAMNSVQPGFYSLSTQIPAVDAVRELVDPASRVGQMIISEGRQLHDTTDVQTGAVKKGIYTLISEASCLGEAGQERCISYDELNNAGAGDIGALGVPDWARDAVAGVPDRDRQLEGLIAAGSWDFDPTAGAAEILRKLVTESAASYEETGILTAGNVVGLSPYRMLIAASLVEREAMPEDFAKVARVILNRLAVNQALQFDSTVNYALDTTELATTDADRATVTPWNTYASPGLPATPISSPSIAALQAVESPEPGDWIYFVTVDAKGTTLFTKSYEEHLSNIDQALNNGILDSGR
ncbi:MULTISPECIES: endolytic transglycosylase MltG [Rhodococcus]|uniref:Endolytic murein transglycosylase n=1 Tax=Rhodococcus oxybenzonivorans TaxID=1990687 RepID=A0AAE4V0C2_9NOCA|nr:MULTISPECIES: endolytic transglycosylase MltG [Rhodococcus]MDV7242582.1 endolytic transglycosylase MltG [Rhodococcus oxybenzonivorans]MDV7266441.1 endolytic transglycosylase MltG [Rhodococcus oxybenzonivorans]MDV7276014.1 endolytic transglycosylase MltG [Rhodococcus oxybenzonivorans]MDV7332071.1 endolytic transglycosylase MltG [Rhodococcus oxybenzonivorans]MDV7344291.1 endolytic transglycosylase MltG [Rhodococcus oxybenzonivorans]